jgi:DNA-binding MarR family transcriptional regulator
LLIISFGMTVMAASGPQTIRAPEPTLGFVLIDGARLYRKRFDQRARADGLGFTRAQWSVLAYLARNEGINQVCLAQLLEIEPITLVRLLDRLEAAGMVERRHDRRDRRSRVLYLTAAAGPVIERMRALGVEVRDEALLGLDADERRQLMALLLRLKNNLGREASEDQAPAREAVHD